jgi:uracil-DNA glycosylase family 4
MEKPGSCAGCPLEVLGRGFVPASIPSGPISLMGVGEAPGATEVTLGRPFVGKSGFFLDRLFRMAGLTRDTWAFHNTLSCQPPNNILRDAPYRDNAIFQCRPNLERSIDRVQPKVLVAFGDTALERLTGKRGIQRYRGFWLIGPRNIPVMPTFHPAYLLPGRTQEELRKDRPSRFIGTVLWDLRRAAKVATSPAPFVRMKQDYLIDPPPSVFKDWALGYQNQLANKGPALLLTDDIETPGKAPKASQQIPMLQQPIIRIGFSFEAGNAVTVPWTAEYLETIVALLQTPGASTGWNSWGFDNPVLEYNLGRPFLRGPHWDMMRAWHVLNSDVPKDLEHVASYFTDLFPWKDLKGTDPGPYNATDADAQIRISYGVREGLQPKGQWDVFERLVAGIFPFLKEAGERGLPIDIEAQAELQKELETELAADFITSQEAVPANFFKEKLYVRKPDRTCTEVTITKEVSFCSCGKEKPTVVHYKATKTRPACDGTPATQPMQVQAWRALADLDPSKPLTYLMDQIGECGFNPLSVAQVTAYANSFRHLDLLKASGARIEGLDDNALVLLIKRFGKDHPIYRIVSNIRQKNKKLSTYVIGYKPDEKGLIHTTYNDNPSTLRIGSQDVNTQNVHAEIKRTIRAPKGWCLVEADASAIEALMVGYDARDPAYVRLAAQGIHDFVLARSLGIPWDPPNTLTVTKSKENYARRQVKKKTVHLSSYGGTPYTMKKQEPDTYTTIGMAEAEQRFFFDSCPTIEKWHLRTRAIVARTHVLINPWGFHQYFYEVFDGDGPGEDFNRCLGAGPQSNAAFVMRENLLLLKDSAWAEFAGANCNTHDSLGLIVPVEKRDAAMDYLLSLMTRPIPQLDGLRIGSEAKYSADGGTWAEMLPGPTVRFDDPLALSGWHRELEAV